jgi:cyanophycinase
LNQDSRGKPLGVAGTFILIGGKEDKEGEREILRAIAQCVYDGKMVIATIASRQPNELWELYRRLFRSLGIKRIAHLAIDRRDQAFQSKNSRLIREANALFFTGGDQLRITSELAGTDLIDAIFQLYERGGVIAGTSAGASAMGETMLISDSDDVSFRSVGTRMTPGLGFVKGIIVDQHFAARGRLGRLLGAVAQNPRSLGVGIDEDTAIVFERGIDSFQVIGSGDVYIVDGHGMTETNVSERRPQRALSLFNAKLHILSRGDRYDLNELTPRSADAASKVR